MPRALIVSYFFPPLGGGGVHRALGWVRHLPSFGWDVTVLSAGPEGYWIHDPTLAARVPAQTEVLRIDAPTAVALWRRFLAKEPGRTDAARDGRLRALARFVMVPDSYRAWARPAIAAGRARLRKGDIDVVVSTSPPETAHLVGEALAHGGPHRRLPWLADFRDPWVGLHYRTPMTPLHAFVHRRMERRVLTGAEGVVCASHTHEEQLRLAMGAERAARLHFLPNGIELDDAPAPAPPGTQSAGARARIVATGTLVEVPALTVFLAALARRLRDEPALRDAIEVVLAGPHEGGLAGTITALGLAGVVLLPGPLPHAEARALQASASALLLVRNEGTGYGAMVPGKLYEYLDARRPLVAMLSESEAAQLARAAGGVVVAPDSGDAAVQAALAATAPPGTAARAGAPAPDEAGIASILATRSRRALAGQLAQILETVRRT